MTYKEVCNMRKVAVRLPVNIPRNLMRVNRLAQAKARGSFMGKQLNGKFLKGRPAGNSWLRKALPWVGLAGAGMALGTHLMGSDDSVSTDQYKETPNTVYTPEMDQSVIQKMRYMSSPYKHSFPAQHYAPSRNSIRQKQEMYS